MEEYDQGKEEGINYVNCKRVNSVYDPHSDIVCVLCSQSRNQSMLNVITFLEGKIIPVPQGSQPFFLTLNSEGSFLFRPLHRRQSKMLQR